MENSCAVAGFESVGPDGGYQETDQPLATPSTLRAFGMRFRAIELLRLSSLASRGCELSHKESHIAPLRSPVVVPKSSAPQLRTRLPHTSHLCRNVGLPLLNKHQRRMPAHSITERLQFPVNRVLSQGRLKCSGIEEDVNVLGETFDEVPSLRKARAALEDDFVTARSSDDTKGLGNVIVFLDDRRTQLTLTEVFGGSQDRLLEIGMLKQSQG